MVSALYRDALPEHLRGHLRLHSVEPILVALDSVSLPVVQGDFGCADGAGHPGLDSYYGRWIAKRYDESLRALARRRGHAVGAAVGVLDSLVGEIVSYSVHGQAGGRHVAHAQLAANLSLYMLP